MSCKSLSCEATSKGGNISPGVLVWVQGLGFLVLIESGRRNDREVLP